jgi:hypothetical protein
MTLIEAARVIHAEAGARWCDCMRWAAQCKREAQKAEDHKRVAYHLARKEELRGLRFRAKLAAAPLVLEGHRGTEGEPGLGISYYPRQEVAA